MKVTLLFSIFLFFSLALCAQLFNSKVLLEPNISISYDSSAFKIDVPYSKLKIQSDRISFNQITEDSTNRIIDIIGHESNDFYTVNLDSSLLEELRDYMKKLHSMIKIVEYDKTIRHINGFSCYGIILLDKRNNDCYCYVIGHRFTGNENMDFRLRSTLPKKLDEEYKVIKLFTKGIIFSSLTK